MADSLSNEILKAFNKSWPHTSPAVDQLKQKPNSTPAKEIPRETLDSERRSVFCAIRGQLVPATIELKSHRNRIANRGHANKLAEVEQFVRNLIEAMETVEAFVRSSRFDDAMQHAWETVALSGKPDNYPGWPFDDVRLHIAEMIEDILLDYGDWQGTESDSIETETEKELPKIKSLGKF